MNFKKIALDGKFTAYLVTQPQPNIDTHVVDVYLKDGSVLKRRLVSHNVYLHGAIGEKIAADDIHDIKISPLIVNNLAKAKAKSDWDDEENDED